MTWQRQPRCRLRIHLTKRLPPDRSESQAPFPIAGSGDTQRFRAEPRGSACQLATIRTFVQRRIEGMHDLSELVASRGISDGAARRGVRLQRVRRTSEPHGLRLLLRHDGPSARRDDARRRGSVDHRKIRILATVHESTPASSADLDYPYWVPADFDVGDHVHVHRAPVAGWAPVRELLGRSLGEPMDLSGRPGSCTS